MDTKKTRGQQIAGEQAWCRDDDKHRLAALIDAAKEEGRREQRIERSVAIFDELHDIVSEIAANAEKRVPRLKWEQTGGREFSADNTAGMQNGNGLVKFNISSNSHFSTVMYGGDKIGEVWDLEQWKRSKAICEKRNAELMEENLV